MRLDLEPPLCARCRVQLMPPVAVSPALGLTRAERAVFEWLCRGLANKQIAERLVISENTVRFHLKRVYAKLGVRSRAHAMARVGHAPAGMAAE